MSVLGRLKHDGIGALEDELERWEVVVGTGLFKKTQANMGPKQTTL